MYSIFHTHQVLAYINDVNIIGNGTRTIERNADLLLDACLLSKNLKIKIYKTIRLPVVLYSCETCSYIKGGTQAKGIWKQDPEMNIWVQ